MEISGNAIIIIDFCLLLEDTYQIELEFRVLVFSERKKADYT